MDSCLDHDRYLLNEIDICYVVIVLSWTYHNLSYNYLKTLNGCTQSI